MGKGACISDATRVVDITWDQVKQHDKVEDKWIVINNNVYDISRWAKRHPGGARIISHYAGEDASEAWTAFHNDKDYVKKFMKPLQVGRIRDPNEPEIVHDFREIRQKAVDMGLFKVNVWFYIAHIAHILALEAVAYFVISSYGIGWVPYLIAAVILGTAQSQAGWSQHDYGHLSVFKSSKMNHIAHQFVIGHLKGASSHWWNFRHFQHHAKPNIVRKDPDINLPYVFLLGKVLPVQWALKKRGFAPYNWQQHYFFLVGPPLLLPTYFHFENIYFIVKRRDWGDMFWMLSFFVKHFALYGPIMGGWGAFWFYMFFRCLESHWFTWVTQMSHIPMDIDHDNGRDWLTMQLKSTCNVDPSLFNDWFTGHLNFQIEHHLFPTMPRHNYIKIKPLVESLCKKHKLNYQSKTLYAAFADIIRSLKSSGELWYEVYHS
ncbi:acyl-CoA Delta-6 desaturase-like [Lineus longissimus]|uniref:acyl-CoA Delta-6 desaturase-like n=1 Tax=Lineus longissimus TaxID=88925 RepID=UPI002B4F3EB8